MPANIPDNLEQQVKEIISSTTGKNIEELKTDANLWTELGIDSIKAIEITVALEKTFKVRVKDEEIPKITTIAQIVEILKGAIEEKAQ